jgi:hypothetical protein
MEKQIVTWCYWLGLANAVMALVLRSLNAAGLLLNQVVKQGQTIWYMSFYKAALLFFLVAVATASYTWMRNQKSP